MFQKYKPPVKEVYITKYTLYNYLIVPSVPLFKVRVGSFVVLVLLLFVFVLIIFFLPFLEILDFVVVAFAPGELV